MGFLVDSTENAASNKNYMDARVAKANAVLGELPVNQQQPQAQSDKDADVMDFLIV